MIRYIHVYKVIYMYILIFSPATCIYTVIYMYVHYTVTFGELGTPICLQESIHTTIVV